MTTRLIAGFVSLLAALPGVARAQTGPLDAARVQQWLAGYEAAWESTDADAAAELFTTDARYYETPYAEPFVGRAGIAEYWSDVTADQREIDFEAEVVAVDGNIGVAHWSVRFLVAEDATIELDGVFVLEFDADGLCSELREWWHMR